MRVEFNRWVPNVYGFDFRTASDEEVREVVKLGLTHTLVVIKDQGYFADPAEEVRLSARIGECEDIPNNEMTKKLGLSDRLNHLFVQGSDRKMIRVTGALDKDGNPGLFGFDHELQWHCNSVHNPERREFLWLRAVEHTHGSLTCWSNGVMAYNDLSESVKSEIADLRCLSFASGVKETQQRDPAEKELRDPIRLRVVHEFTPKLVHTNCLGVTGLFFPPDKIVGFPPLKQYESKRLIRYLREHCFKPEYTYDHPWVDGDLTISSQWLGCHKRPEYHDMRRRYLHRIILDHENILPTKKEHHHE
jgi:alpha-ketoglutarate-dependent taurine dioxygenase